QDVHVREVHERDTVREGPRKADLPLAVVEPDDSLRFADEPFDGLAGTSFGPVRLVRKEVVHRVDVDPAGIVVELQAVAELPSHRRNPRRTNARRCAMSAAESS